MPGLSEFYPDGSRKVWDGPTATYTEYAPDGSTTHTRPFTAEETAAYPPHDSPADLAVTAAQREITTLHSAVPAWKSQLQADITLVQTTGWDALLPADRTAVILRMLNGFGTAMTGLIDHATVTGAISPS